jgi:hypothetical protein
MPRSGTVRVLRNNEVLYEGELLSLKHLKVRSFLNNAQRHSAHTEKQRGSLRGGELLSLRHLKVRSFLNNAQRHSARIGNEYCPFPTREGKMVNNTCVRLLKIFSRYIQPVGPISYVLLFSICTISVDELLITWLHLIH